MLAVGVWEGYTLSRRMVWMLSRRALKLAISCVFARWLHRVGRRAESCCFCSGSSVETPAYGQHTIERSI